MTLVALVKSMGADVTGPCQTCTKPIATHDDGELLWCFTLFVAQASTRAGVQRQLKRRVGRIRRGKR